MLEGASEIRLPALSGIVFASPDELSKLGV